MSQDKLESFISSLERELALYSKIKDQADKQLSIIDALETATDKEAYLEKLTIIANDKKIMLEELEKLQRESAEIRDTWQSLKTTKDHSQRIETLLQNIKKLLAEIVSLENACFQRVSTTKDKCQETIKKFTTIKKGTTNYKQTSNQPKADTNILDITN